MVRAWSALDEVARDWREPFCGLVQEYLPDDSSEDWIVHGYWGSDDESTAVFTGRELRSWPPHFGRGTAYARVESNDELVGMTRRLCEQLQDTEASSTSTGDSIAGPAATTCSTSIPA